MWIYLSGNGVPYVKYENTQDNTEEMFYRNSIGKNRIVSVLGGDELSNYTDIRIKFKYNDNSYSPEVSMIKGSLVYESETTEFLTNGNTYEVAVFEFDKAGYLGVAGETQATISYYSDGVIMKTGTFSFYIVDTIIDEEQEITTTQYAELMEIIENRWVRWVGTETELENEDKDLTTLYITTDTKKIYFYHNNTLDYVGGFSKLSELENDVGYLTATSETILSIEDDISGINAKIPTQASSNNQLADKDFVNSSLNSITAFYITKNANGDAFENLLELAQAQVYYSGGEVRVPTRNDYLIVRVDELHDNATTRYIYQNGGWEYQYMVNETALTAAQLAAINSGITSTWMTNITNNKQNVLISGQTIKTINNQSLLGSGNITISGSGTAEYTFVIDLDRNGDFPANPTITESEFNSLIADFEHSKIKASIPTSTQPNIYERELIYFPVSRDFNITTFGALTLIYKLNTIDNSVNYIEITRTGGVIPGFTYTIEHKTS